MWKRLYYYCWSSYAFMTFSVTDVYNFLTSLLGATPSCGAYITPTFILFFWLFNSIYVCPTSVSLYGYCFHFLWLLLLLFLLLLLLLLFFKLGFNPCKAEQPLQGMELWEKEAQKAYSIQEVCLERTYS